MESKLERVEMLQTAIKQLMEEEKRSYKDVLVADCAAGQKVYDHRLLSNLLSQVEELKDDAVPEEVSKTCIDVEKKEVLPEPEVSPTRKKTAAAAKEFGCSSEEVKGEEIIKELRKVRRQNLITHFLLSAMIVLTVTWQLSEVSLILKVKEGLNHPLRSIGGLLTGMFKRSAPAGNSKEDENQPSPRHGQNQVLEAALPGLKIPELPHLELPSFGIDHK